MIQNRFRYYAALHARDGARIADVRLDEIDWVPAIRWAEFEHGTKAGVAPDPGAGPLIAEPRWNPAGRPPYVGGIDIRRDGDRKRSVEIPLTYFSAAVQNAATGLVDRGELAAGQPFEYKVFALEDTRGHDAACQDLEVVAVAAAPPVASAALAPLLEQAEPAPSLLRQMEGSAQPLAATMPIFIPQSVLEQTTALALAAGEVESGGFLIGLLCRDPDGTLFARITAFMPAEQTIATRHSLRFTPQTWASVAGAMKLRAARRNGERGHGGISDDEILLGWAHHHGYFCRNCPSESRAVCAFASPTFSLADRDLHREVFQAPYSIALLLSFYGEDRPTSYDVFAWDRGEIRAARYYVLPDRPRKESPEHE